MSRCVSCGISLSGSDEHDLFCESAISSTREEFERLKNAERELTAERDHFKAALEIYGAHKLCGSRGMNAPDRPCDCGLEKAKMDGNSPVRVRLVQASQDMLDLVKKHLQESGCDGDLCSRSWHEEFRGLIRKVEEEE